MSRTHARTHARAFADVRSFGDLAATPRAGWGELSLDIFLPSPIAPFMPPMHDRCGFVLVTPIVVLIV